MYSKCECAPLLRCKQQLVSHRAYNISHARWPPRAAIVMACVSHCSIPIIECVQSLDDGYVGWAVLNECVRHRILLWMWHLSMLLGIIFLLRHLLCSKWVTHTELTMKTCEHLSFSAVEPEGIIRLWSFSVMVCTRNATSTRESHSNQPYRYRKASQSNGAFYNRNAKVFTAHRFQLC